MSDYAPSAEHIRAAQDDPRWHENGEGPFVLITHAFIPRDGAIEDYVCRHRFLTVEARDNYSAIARQSGLRVEVVE